MRYFVVADDGSKYGPAELATLNTWIQEGRIVPSTLLEEESSGARIAAAAVAGLTFPSARATEATTPQGSIYSTPGGTSAPGPQNPYNASYGANYAAPKSNEGNTEVVIAWIMAVCGLLGTCCCAGWIFGIIGALLGNSAKQKGNSNGQAALIANVVVAVLSLLFAVVLASTPTFRQGFMQSFNQGMQRGQQQQANPQATGP